MFTDGSYISGAVITVQQRLRSNHQNTYVYFYTHKGISSLSPTTDFFGTTHADDLLPLFPLRETAMYSSIPTDNDRELTRLMTLMWTNFAITG